MNRLLRCFCNFTVCLALLLFPTPTAHALTALFTDGTTLASLSLTHPSLYAAIKQGMEDAAAAYSQSYSNPVTVRLTVDMMPNLGALMATGPSGGYVPYAEVAAVLPSLPTQPPPSSSFWMGDSLQTVDASQVFLTTAQMAALNVFDTPLRLTQSAGVIYLSTENQWDFNAQDGISPGKFDFVGLFRHEIGHDAGFVSAMNGVGAGRAGSFSPTLLDLFRFGAPGVRSFWGDTYFSTDEGVTPIQFFEPGVSQGGGQAEHWRSLGETMSAFAVAGTEIHFSANDEKAFSTIGWKRTNEGASEPSTLCFITLLLCALKCASLIRKRYNKSVS